MAKQRMVFTTLSGVLSLVASLAAPAAAQSDDEREVQDSLSGDIDSVSWGIGARARYVFFPKSLLEQFVAEAPSGVGEAGFGIEVVRRKEEFAIHIGLEHEDVKTEEGFWEDNDGAVDKVEYPDGLAWTTLDVAFVFHRPLHEMLALRYGAGLGVGLIHGVAEQTDATCTGPDIQRDCSKITDPAMADDFEDDAGVPRIFPVVNITLGLQFRPIEQLAINIEGGMRTLFFAGVSSTYFF